MATAAATGGANNLAREARRRRIIERGSDRLALISGRIQSLPPDPDQSVPSTRPPPQIPATDSSQHEEDAAANSSPPNGESVQEQAQEATANSLLPNQESVKEHEQHAVPDTGRILPSKSVALHDDTNDESSQIPPPPQRPAQDRQIEQTRHHSLFTPGKIKSAVAASENARIYCSVAAAVLVIASYLKLPIVGFGGIMLFRPFYLLLLTNATIVLGRVIMGGWGVESRTRRTSAPAAGGNDLADQLGRALEIGLLMQRILGAVSMDFSIYAVVLVCGLSLAQMLV